MLKVSYYKKSNEILKADLPQNLLVVCPSPILADSFREISNSKYEVTTIAKWISETKLEDGFKKVGKSEMMLRLASAWDSYFPNESEHLFYNAFEIFTEIRSFTLDFEVIKLILQELDEKISKSIQVFWAVLKAEKLIDEHENYLIKQNTKIERAILFLGFKHLSAVQIEMVKTLADDQDIYFFIPSSVKKASHSTDWINWLDTKLIKEIESIESKKEISVVYYPEKKLNLYLDAFNKKNGLFDLSFIGGSDGLLNLQEVLVNDFQFKESIDLFFTQKKQLFEKLKKNQNGKVSDIINELSTQKDVALKSFNYLEVKVLELTILALEIFSEYSDHFNMFVLGLINQVVDLNSPRNFIIPVQEKSIGKVIGFEELKYCNQNSQIALILSKEKSPFSSSVSKYPENVLKILKTIGPIRRNGLDVLFVKHDLAEFLLEKNATLFLEEGMLETDPGVRDLSILFDFNQLDLDIVFQQKKIKDIVATKVTKNNLEKTYSASKLQIYYDCPRKYYISYYDKLEDTPKEKTGLAPDEKGNLEHLIIEDFLTKYEQFNLDQLKKLCQEKLDHHIQSNKIKISFDEYNEIYFELVEYTQNAINFIFELKMNRPNAKIYFEYPLPENKYQMRGFIDCLLIEENRVEIYDFKRSQSSVGTKKELLEFEKIQLWVYANAVSCKFEVEKIGYINISEIENNVIIESKDLLTMFDEYLASLIKSYNEETTYLPKPRNEFVCSYCSINKICPKGVI